MLTFLFQRICGMHQIRFLTAYRKDIRYTRFTLRDRTGLIECNDLYLACLLQRNGRLKQDSMLCTHTISNHDGNRSCKSKCTRTADNQNGNRSCKRISYRSSYKHPNYKCHDCNADNDRYKYTGHFICDLRNRRFRCRCITDHMNDLRQRRILADTGCLTEQISGLIECRSRYWIARILVNRDTLSGQCGFIDCTVSFLNKSIHRNILTRTDCKQIADMELLDWHCLLHTILD